jgi:hypothetical protein
MPDLEQVYGDAMGPLPTSPDYDAADEAGTPEMARRTYAHGSLPLPPAGLTSQRIIWNEKLSHVNAAVENAIAAGERLRDGGTPDVIVASYDDTHPANRGISLQDRLISLEQEILNLTVDL